MLKLIFVGNMATKMGHRSFGAGFHMTNVLIRVNVGYGPHGTTTRAVSCRL